MLCEPSKITGRRSSICTGIRYARVGGEARELDLVERRRVLWSLSARAGAAVRAGDRPGAIAGRREGTHLTRLNPVLALRAADPRSGSALHTVHKPTVKSQRELTVAVAHFGIDVAVQE